jgi:hypothetical protein
MVRFAFSLRSSNGAWPHGKELGKLREKHIQDLRPVLFRHAAKTAVIGGSRAVSFHPTVKAPVIGGGSITVSLRPTA